MLVRPDGDGVLAIGQPAHAWLAGQLARAWGNERFGEVEPREEACLAAEQHDEGWSAWDAAPRRDPETGWPYDFMSMPLGTHLDVLRAGPDLLLPQSRYAALLTSLHASALYARRDLTEAPPEDAADIRAFLADHEATQERLRAMLRADPATRAHAEEGPGARNQRLLWTWDGLSLALLLDWLPYTATRVPTAREAVDVQLAWLEPGRRASVDPWPFAGERVTARCEARRLERPADSDAGLRDALAAAPWVTLDFELVPA